MQTKALSLAVMTAIGFAAATLMQPAQARVAPPTQAGDAQISCDMTFSLAGWSVIYKTATGTGVVTCSNGQTRKVKLSVKGAGLTAGKYKVTEGHAAFTDVNRIQDIFGSYGEATAHAGATKSVRGTVMTKGNVTMSLGGTGNGWDLGVGVGDFTIEPINGAKWK